MNRITLFLVLASALAFGAGCASGRQSSSDGLFIGSDKEQGSAPVLSNSGTLLPSSANQPSKIGPQ